jgi:prepilin-type N-terminal cleavage/methylation domain-containing protein
MKRASRPARHGFTFVEVLIALLVAALLASAAASALITSLRAEETAARLEEAALLVPSVFARSCRGPEETNLVTAAGWTTNSDVFETRSESATNMWRVWMMFPADRPSLSVTLALREVSADSGP